MEKLCLSLALLLYTINTISIVWGEKNGAKMNQQTYEEIKDMK